MSTDYKLLCREHNVAIDACSRQAFGVCIASDGHNLANFIIDHQSCKLEVAREGSDEFQDTPDYQGS